MSFLLHSPNGKGLACAPDAIASATALRAQYQAAQPFPHIVIDDFLDSVLAERLATAFPPEALASVHRRNRHQNGKRGYRPATLGTHPSSDLLAAFNSVPMLETIEALTGHCALMPDSEFVGGGFHEIERGGHLSVHADFQLHPGLGLARRVNLILFLNREWDREWGGALELWDHAAARCEVSILPRFNRAVIFDTGRSSYHGHPRPLRCPIDVRRRSLALYFYNRPEAFERLDGETRWREGTLSSALHAVRKRLRVAMAAKST